jgi:hypothetical protein
MIAETKILKLYQLKNNLGQIEGLPKNPRLIKDNRFNKLLKSIQDDPDMMQLRELIVYPYTPTLKSKHQSQIEYIVIAGNMRLHAVKEIGWAEVPCKILEASTSLETLKAITIKDNVSFGENDYDLLANDWEQELLEAMGMDIMYGMDEMMEEAEKVKNDDKAKKITLRYNTEAYASVTDYLLSVGTTLEEGLLNIIEEHKISTQ